MDDHSSQPAVPGFPQGSHHVDAHTGATQIHPYLGSAAGHRPKKRRVWDVTWEEWKNAQWLGRGKAPQGGPHHDSLDAYSGASRFFSEEEHVLFNIQEFCRPYPGAVKAAQLLSHFGEHSLGWLGLSAVGAWLMPQKRQDWMWAGVAAFGAHALSVILKRIVRRPRPDNPAIDVNVSTPSQLSFPSSHATSTTAWAVSASMILGTPAPLVLSPVMMYSRMLAGVHYPTDVAAGAALGAACSVLVHRLGDKVLRLVGGHVPMISRALQ